MVQSQVIYCNFVINKIIEQCPCYNQNNIKTNISEEKKTKEYIFV